MRLHVRSALTCAALLAVATLSQADTVVIGWNDLGMHCMDGSDFSVFSILPPYNTVDAHVIQDGELVASTNAHLVTYKAVADASGSINRTTADKINFWDYEYLLFGTNLDPDQGLTGVRMPGTNNVARQMHYNASLNWFAAEGIPLSPFDDSGTKNYYPMFRLEARDRSSNVLAHTDIVLPVSDEMHCSACHHSGAGNAARPAAGWAWECDGDRDYKFNVLRLHDEHRGASQLYRTALAGAGHNTNGLYWSVRFDARPVLCAQCHRSNALPGMGSTNIAYFTSAIHSRHSGVIDPDSGMTLESSENRDSCYRCHPGSSTRCLRGAMGKAVAADGALAMSCQSCHGSMSAVGSAQRDGWFDEPVCQACHTGTATDNNGQIRYTNVFVPAGSPRVAVNGTFATDADTPLAGKSLYRFSSGHGGLQCSACHGSTHAVYPSSHLNDNVQNETLQGHAGTLVECQACHGGYPQTFLGGPHGMHPIADSDFVVKHDNREQWHHKQVDEDSTPEDITDCQSCHGTDYRGTVLSRAHADRSVDTGDFGVLNVWRGQTIGCYSCHNGPLSESPSANASPSATGVPVLTTANTSTNISLVGSDPDGVALTWRIVTQPGNGTVALSSNLATYTPFENYLGDDSFTFAATDAAGADSNLATGSVTVIAGPPIMTCNVVAPTSIPVHVAAPFEAFAHLDNTTGALSYAWAFGDGSAAGEAAQICHRYCSAGSYTWTSIVSAAGLAVTNVGHLQVTDTVIDEDADGIGDYWELGWFGRLGHAGAGTDSDGDDAPDRDEWQSGTIPTDPTSRLEFTTITRTAGGRVVLGWRSVSNRQYSLVSQTNLLVAAPSAIASNILASPPANTYTTAPPSADSAGMYRIKTSLGSGCPALP